MKYVVVVLLLLSLSCRTDPNTYVQRGKKALASGNYEEALLNFRKAIQRDAQLGEAYYELGRLEIRRNDLLTAHKALTRAVELLPRHQEAKAELGDLVLSILARERGDQRSEVLYKQLDTISADLLRISPDSFDGLRLKAGLTALKQHTEEAITLLERANRQKQFDARVVLPLAQLLLTVGRAVEAEQMGKQLLESRKDFSPIYDFLYAFYMRGNRQLDAEELLRAKVRNNPKEGAHVVQLATHFARTGNRAAMDSTLNEMLSRTTEYPSAPLMAGDFYFRLQENERALRIYEQGAKSHPPGRLTYLQRIADTWLAESKPEQATKVIDEILALKPGDDTARVVKASIQLQSNQPQQIETALKELRSLVAKDPANGLWRFRYGQALLLQGRLEDARTQFREAAKRRPDLLSARLALTQLSENLGDFREALRNAEELLQLNPSLPKVRLLRAVALTGLERYSEARTELSRLSRQLPGYEEVMFQLAVLDLREGKSPLAERQFRRIYAGDRTNIRALRGLVESLYAQQQHTRAVELLQSELKDFPKSQAIRGLLAQTQLQAGKSADAIINYQVLASANSDDASLLIQLGTAYQYNGQLAKALEQMERARMLAPTQVLPAILVAQLHDLMGRKTEAIQTYRQALVLSPEDIVVINNLAFLLADTGGDLDEAEKLIRQALQKSPQAADPADTLGWIYFKRNNLDQAIHIFRSLANKYPENPNFRFHHGLTLLRRGDKESARIELQASLDSNPNSLLVSQIKGALTQAESQ